MESAQTWKKVAATLGAAAVLALVVRRLRLQAEEARPAAAAAPSARAKAEEKLQAKTAPAEPAKKEAAPPPAEPAADAGLGLEAQKAAALGGAARAWAPDFNAPLEEDIERRLRARFNPTYLELVNQGSCEALKLGVNMVSEAFRGQARVNRQRDVQAVLKADLDTGRLHALSMQLKTPEEYAKLTEKQSQEAQPATVAPEPSKVSAVPAKAPGPEPPAAPDADHKKKPAEGRAAAKADAKAAPKAKEQPAAGAEKRPEAEKRLDPYSGKVQTLDQLKAYYKGSYSPKQVEEYWRSECKISDKTGGRKDHGDPPRNRAKAKPKPK